jgi:hypothetical protein
MRPSWDYLRPNGVVLVPGCFGEHVDGRTRFSLDFSAEESVHGVADAGPRAIDVPGMSAASRAAGLRVVEAPRSPRRHTGGPPNGKIQIRKLTTN